MGLLQYNLFSSYLRSIKTNPFLLLFAAGFLFALSFPSSLAPFSFWPFSLLGRVVEQGLPIMAFVFALPLLQVLQQLRSLGQSIRYGAFYGFSSYLLLSLWLLTYDWIAFILIPGIYLYYFSIFFTAHLLLKKIMAKYALPSCLNYFSFVALWLLLEYLKSTGWVAYTYGSLLYSHYLYPHIIYFSRNFFLQNLAYILLLTPSICCHAWLTGKKPKFKKWGLLFASLAIAILNLTFIAKVDNFASVDSHTELLRQTNQKAMPTSPNTLNIALIQHNINSWQTEKNTDRQALNRLLVLSRQAEKANAELIIWSETAFVPRFRSYRNQKLGPIKQSIEQLEQQLHQNPDTNIAKNLNYFRLRYNEILLSHKLQNYLKQVQATYLIGTNDNKAFVKEKRWGLYNGMLLIRNGEILATYHKKRLVPFSEEAKFEDLLPELNNYLQKNNFAQYSSGTGSPIVPVPLQNKTLRQLNIYAMICYEDSLPLYWPHRLFTPPQKSSVLAKQNFDILLSISNDSWSPSPVGGLQHLSSSISRAVETQKYFLRGSTSGQTTAISPKGQILQRLPANVPAILYFRLPLDKLNGR